MTMKRTIIAAVADNGVIGNNGDIPWHYEEDLQHFREATMGSPVIMGRKTYDSLPEPLDGRANIVLTTQDVTYDDLTVFTADGFDDAFTVAEAAGADTAYIAGGATIYEQALEHDLVDEMLLTAIPERPDGDTYFPAWEYGAWERQEKTATDGEKHDPVNIYRYRRLRDDQ